MEYRLLVVAGKNETLLALPSQLSEVEVKLVEMANEALWELRSDPPHAIVAGFDLPDMSGLDLAEIIPNFDLPTPIILVSSTVDLDAQQRAAELGVHGFLENPSHEALKSMIDSALKLGSELMAQQAEEEEEAEPEPEPPAPSSYSEPITPVIERIERTPPPAESSRSQSVIERIERTPPASESAAPEAPARPSPVIERIERTPPASETPPEPLARTPARRVVPNPDPPYQPPERASSRRVTARPGGGLGGRVNQARVAAQQNPKPTPPEPTPEPAPSQPGSRGGGITVVDRDRASRIQSVLSDLWQSLSAQCTLLTDRAGMVLAQHGETDGLPMMILLPLLSTSFSTAGEVARQLHEEDAMTLYMHDGARYNLYCFDISQRFLLVVVFDKNIAATRIGSVWVEARSTIRKLKETLK
jgi:CheY-like chemotaxis protein/predicted regulator of Ras-like GTPase activity (Roadblock/LC7/MglB family)